MRWICNRLWRIVAVGVALLLIGAAFFMWIEAPAKDYVQSLYWAITTASSTGYGDQLPTKTESRGVAAALMASFQWFVSPVETALITARMVTHRDAWTDEEQVRMFEKLERLDQELVHTQETLATIARDIHGIQVRSGTNDL